MPKVFMYFLLRPDLIRSKPLRATLMGVRSSWVMEAYMTRL